MSRVVKDMSAVATASSPKNGLKQFQEWQVTFATLLSSQCGIWLRVRTSNKMTQAIEEICLEKTHFEDVAQFMPMLAQLEDDTYQPDQMCSILDKYQDKPHLLDSHMP